MRLLINGEEREFAEPLMLSELIAELKMKQDRVAVERNGEIVPRDQWASTALADRDRLEVVHFVGGGRSGLRVAPQAIATRGHNVAEAGLQHHSAIGERFFRCWNF